MTTKKTEPTHLESLPSGTMVELSTGLIGEGKFIEEIDRALAEAAAALVKRKSSGERSGSCKITATIDVGYDPDIEDHVTVVHCVVLKTPKNEKMTLVKEKGGRLLCDPSGSTASTPDQLRLFDRNGRPTGVLDTRTGELLEPPTTAGKIGT